MDKSDSAFIRDRFRSACRICFCIGLDALVAVFLAACAMGVHLFIDFCKHHGFVPWAAIAFEVVTQLGILLIAIIGIASDVKKCYQQEFRTPLAPPENGPADRAQVASSVHVPADSS